MYIYVDESGSFVKPKQGHRVSALGAIVIPQCQRRSLLRALKALLTAKSDEIKGSNLNEAEIAKILTIAGKYDVLVEICAIDMGMQTESEIKATQQSQAANFIAALTPQHSKAWHNWADRVSAALLGLSSQLFVQCMVTVELLSDLLESASMYYAQRMPGELGRFAWRVDAKDINVTPYEKLWTEIILPFAQAKSMIRPVISLTDANYDDFNQKFEFNSSNAPKSVREYMETREVPSVIDLRKVFRDDFLLVNSKDDIGVRLADVVVSAFTRAVNGTLGEVGWLGLGPLLVRGPRDAIRMIELSEVPREPEMVTTPYGSVIRRMTEQARDILRSESSN